MFASLDTDLILIEAIATPLSWWWIIKVNRVSVEQHSWNVTPRQPLQPLQPQFYINEVRPRSILSLNLSSINRKPRENVHRWQNDFDWIPGGGHRYREWIRGIEYQRFSKISSSIRWQNKIMCLIYFSRYSLCNIWQPPNWSAWSVRANTVYGRHIKIIASHVPGAVWQYSINVNIATRSIRTHCKIDSHSFIAAAWMLQQFKRSRSNRLQFGEQQNVLHMRHRSVQ